MSIRPKDAHSFSLEHVFDEEAVAAPEAAAPSAPPALLAPLAPLGPPAAPSKQLTFTLPVLKSVGAPRAPATQTQRVLAAGFLVGGGHASVAETTRLRAVVEEVQSKLKSTQERLALTEQSVARGNAALASERATNHARIVALTSQLKSAAEDRASAQAQLKNAPVATSDAKFAIAVKGAMDASERSEALERQTAALQKELEARTNMAAEHEALLAEHEALNAQLQAATASFAEATETSERVRHEALLMVRDAEARAEASEAATASAEATAAKAVAAAEAAADNSVGMDFHTRAVCDLREELVAAQRHKATAEQKSLEADEIIKALDTKLALLRSELDSGATKAAAAAATAAPTEAPTPTIAEHKVREFEQYALLKASAEEALAAGHRDAGFLHHAAMQQYATLATPRKRAAFLCCPDGAGEPAATATDMATAAATATALAIHEAPLFGRGFDDARDLFGSTETTIAQEARTKKYVCAVSKDVKCAVATAVCAYAKTVGEEPPKVATAEQC